MAGKNRAIALRAPNLWTKMPVAGTLTARNNRDWHHLIDLCAMAGTLVIDHDRVYVPGPLNDRLLLGRRSGKKQPSRLRR